MAKFATNASGAIWWPNLQLMQVAPYGGQICYKCKCQVQSKLRSQFLGPLYLWQCFLFQVNATKNLPTKHLPYTSYRACTTLLKHVRWSIQATLTSWRPRINLALHVAGVMSDNTKLHQYHSFKIIFTIKTLPEAQRTQGIDSLT